jgi:uncharacterized membrane protein YpjA
LGDKLWGLSQHDFINFLIAGNLIGALYGFYYYIPQLMQTSSMMWMFVWDCPLYCLFFSLWLIGWRQNNYNVQDSLLQCVFVLWTATGLIKYGLWTEVIIIDAWSDGYPIEFATLYFFITHVIMMAEGFFLLAYVLPLIMYNRTRWIVSCAVVLTWMLGNDVIDYAWNVHPWLFSANQFTLAQGTAVSSTILFVLYAFFSCLHIQGQRSNQVNSFYIKKGWLR